MIKKIFVSAMVLVAFLGYAPAAHAYIAQISTTIGGTPNPIKVHSKFNQWMTIRNVDTVPVLGLRLEYVAPTTPGLKLLNYTVTRLSDGLVLCKTVICTAGTIAPNDGVKVTVNYQAKFVGNYDYLWYVTHDSWLTPYGGLLTVVKR